MLDWLLDTDPFVTRNHCGTGWGAGLVWAYLAGNAVIALSYLCLAYRLAVCWRRKREVWPKPWIILAFAGFIGLCGLTHVADVLVFGWAPYRLYTLVVLMTAAVSLPTAVLFPFVAKYVEGLRSGEEYERLLKELRDKDAAKDAAFDALRAEFERKGRKQMEMKAEMDAMRETIRHFEWRADMQDDVKKLREQLHNLRGAAQ